MATKKVNELSKELTEGDFLMSSDPNTIYIRQELIVDNVRQKEKVMNSIVHAKTPAELVPTLKSLVDFKARVDEREKQFKDAIKEIKENFARAHSFYDGAIKAAKDVALGHYLANANVTKALNKKTGELMELTDYEQKLPAFVISKPANQLVYDDNEVLENHDKLRYYVDLVKVVNRELLEKDIMAGKITSNELKSLRIIESDPKISFYPGKL